MRKTVLQSKCPKFNLGPPKKSQISGLRTRRLRPANRHFLFIFLFFYYVMLSNCSQNCWIDWNSAVLCFKRLFHRGVWTFARFVRPSCFVYGKFGRRVYMYHWFWSRLMTRHRIIFFFKFGPCLYNVSRIFLLAKKNRLPKIIKKRITAPILKPTDVKKPETFFGGLMGTKLLAIIF